MSETRYFEIHYSKAAEKFFKKHEMIRQKFECAICDLIEGDDVKKVDVKQIRGKKSVYYRIRIGDCRVIYTVINGKIIVIETLLAGNRGDVYKKMKGWR